MFKISDGNSKCLSCPIGAVCENGEIEAKEGWWMVRNDGFANHSLLKHEENGVVRFKQAVSGDESETNSENVVELYPCLETEICVENGCEEGMHRNASLPICESCNDGFMKLKGECVECKNTAGNIVLFVLSQVFLVILFLLVSHVFANSVSSMIVKTLLFYTQTLQLIRFEDGIGSFKESSRFVEIIMECVHVVTKMINFIFSFGVLDISETICFHEFSSYMSIFWPSFVKFITFLVCLIILLFCCICDGGIRCSIYSFLSLAKMKRKRPGSIQEDDYTGEVDQGEGKYLLDGEGEEEENSINNEKNDEENEEKKNKVGEHDSGHHHSEKKFNLCSFICGYFTSIAFFKTTTFVFNVIFEVLLDDVFVFFSCAEFGKNGRRVVEYTDISCSTNDYYGWSVYYAFVILFLVFFPFVIVVWLCCNRKNLEKHKFEAIFGEFYEFYKPSFYWFEFITTMKRYVVVFVSWISIIFVTDFETRYVLVSWVILVFFLIQVIFRPFNRKFENFQEELCYLLLLGMSIYRVTSLGVHSASSNSSKISMLLIGFCGMVYFFVAVFLYTETCCWVSKNCTKWCCTCSCCRDCFAKEENEACRDEKKVDGDENEAIEEECMVDESGINLEISSLMGL